MLEAVPAGDFVTLVRSPSTLDALLDREAPVVVVDLDCATPSVAGVDDAVRALPCVVVGVSDGPMPADDRHSIADVMLHRDDHETLARIETTARSAPRASTALVLLLRSTASRSLVDGLVAESAVYSMLQCGPEFAAWHDAYRPARHDEAQRPAVRIERADGVLHVTLARPEVHNALNTQMRDELYEALSVAVSDPELRVVLEGEGPSFCAGGDLDEFGTRPDPPLAHMLRLRRSVGRLLALVADRVEVRVHGACRGSGVELPAFARRVVARGDATFGLPEVALGLVPGAGGTVSIPRRIGRWRTAQLALTGQVIDAATAQAWGLVDAVVT
jgi:hypothetical protein